MPWVLPRAGSDGPVYQNLNKPNVKQIDDVFLAVTTEVEVKN